MLQSEIPPIDGTGGGNSTSVGVGGGGPDPNSVVVFLSNATATCEDPFGSSHYCEAELHWTVSFDIPPELQAPGTYNLQDLNAFASFDGSNGSPDDCFGGGGSFWDGQVVITAIDAQTVNGTLIGTDTYEFDANGDFAAPRCLTFQR
jgi:hypothetical protein